MERFAPRAVAFFLLALPASSAWSQLTTTTGFTPAYIVQNVLLGPGVTASNFVFLGDADQMGTFTCAGCNLGLTDGVVLATGSVPVVEGPNISGSFTLGGGNFGVGDPDLNQILSVIPTTANDRASLEFDFIPTGDSVKFNFVFGSDEYNEYVCGTVNDVFAFFLSGPGISGPFSGGAENIALVPGTSVPISINTVNNGTVGANGTLINCVNADPNWTANNIYYTDNTGGLTVQLDGFTVVLTAAAQVICGQTYHIKIAIADAGDTVFDSAVFIEAGSFQSNVIDITSNIISGGVDSVLYEGCGHTTLVFVRAGDLSDSLQVDLVETGTATNGVDHTLFPGTVYFLPGQDSLLIDVYATLDALAEGLEQVILTATYNNGCATGTSDIVFYISDALPINLTISNDTTLTCTDSTFVQATATGGYGTLYYDWNTGIPDGTLGGWVSPPATTTYILTVTDDCGVVTETVDVTITIPILPPMQVQAVPDTLVFCPESPVDLQAVVSGGQPGYSYLWSGGLGTGTSAAVAPPTTQTWSLTVTDLCGSALTDQVTVTVQYDTVQVFITPDTTICNGDTITLHAIPSQGWGGYSVLWDNGFDQLDRDVHPSTNSIYDVIVTDGCGISAADAVGVGVNSPQADFTYTGSVYVENFPVQFLDLSMGAVTWSWDFGYPDLVSDVPSPVITYPADGLFNVMLAITDPLGCADTTWRTIFINPEFLFYTPNAFTPDGDGQNDLFFGHGVGMDAYEMRVFDRWGELIHQTAELYGTWDGTVNGQPAPTGVYVYWFRLHAISGRSSEYTGHVTLLR